MRIPQRPLFTPLVLGLASILSVAASSRTATAAPNTPSSSATRSGEREFGAGIVIGEPTGLTGKWWIDREHAADFGVAFSFDDYALFYGDYLFHLPGLFGGGSQFVSELNPYVGGGLVLAISGDKQRNSRAFFDRDDSGLGVGIRVPVGIEWLPARVPIGVFAELVPGISIVPSTEGIFEGGVGIRYYF